MGETLNTIFSWAAIWWWLAGIAVVAFVLYVLQDTSFFLTDLSYRFPLIGRLRFYAHDYSKNSRPGWLNVEMRLCRDYRRHVTSMPREQFDNYVTYLKKAYDDARTPMPWWAMVGMGLLIALEGLGFAYLLGSIIAIEGSENTRTLLMIAVTVVLALILFVVNHAAGHNLFRWKLLRSCFRSYQANNDPHYSSATVSLDQDQRVDDDQRPHVQVANRVITRTDDRGSLLWLAIAIGLTLGIAIGSTMLRDQLLSVAELETASPVFQLFGEGAPAAADAGPAAAGIAAARHAAAWVGYLILGLLFVVTQFVGIEVGRRWGFAGRQSAKAFRTTGGYADYEAYYRPIQQRINIASARLETLQQLLERGSPSPLDFDMTFIDFILEERKRGATDLRDPAPSVAPPVALLTDLRPQPAEEPPPPPVAPRRSLWRRILRSSQGQAA